MKTDDRKDSVIVIAAHETAVSRADDYMHSRRMQQRGNSMEDVLTPTASGGRFESCSGCSIIRAHL